MPSPQVVSVESLMREVLQAQDHITALRGDLISTEDVKSAMRDGFLEGVKVLMQDKDFAKSFWQQGYEQLTQHAGNGASQWVGKRILTALVVAVTTACVIWLVKTGAIK